MEVTLAIELGGAKNSVGLVGRDGKVVDSGVLDAPEALDGLWEQIEAYLEGNICGVAPEGWMTCPPLP